MKHLLLFVLSLSSLASFAYEADSLSYPKIHISNNEIDKQIRELNFTQASALIKKEIDKAKKAKQPTAAYDTKMAHCHNAQVALMGTDQVVVIDSIVVDKEHFLSAYPMNGELGTIEMSDGNELTFFTTERGNKVYKVERMVVNAETGDEALQIVSYFKDGDVLSNPNILEGLKVDGDLNYPFLMSDGITFYFAARSSDGIGNYDLYVTRYDSDGDRFYKADNLGFPYNSYANDYMMVVDEENQLGWFASDRYQPSGKVCIYTFIPNSSRHPFDSENIPEQTLRAAASLRSIASTWNDNNKQDRIQARQRLALMSQSAVSAKPWEFTLVINDSRIYHYFTDFQQPAANEKAQLWHQHNSNVKSLVEELNEYRFKYAKSSASERSSMKTEILNLERRINELNNEINKLENEIRNIEK